MVNALAYIGLTRHGIAQDGFHQTLGGNAVSVEGYAGDGVGAVARAFYFKTHLGELRQQTLENHLLGRRNSNRFGEEQPLRGGFLLGELAHVAVVEYANVRPVLVDEGQTCGQGGDDVSSAHLHIVLLAQKVVGIALGEVAEQSGRRSTVHSRRGGSGVVTARYLHLAGNGCGVVLPSPDRCVALQGIVVNALPVDGSRSRAVVGSRSCGGGTSLFERVERRVDMYLGGLNVRWCGVVGIERGDVGTCLGVEVEGRHCAKFAQGFANGSHKDLEDGLVVLKLNLGLCGMDIDVDARRLYFERDEIRHL